jgi:membrane associated rhomboid family serine protease
MARYPSRVTYSFGPGGITPAVKMLIIANVAIYLLFILVPAVQMPIGMTFGLRPSDVLTRGWVWQLVTYMFLHSPAPSHVLFNMLSLWMFGTDLERDWGTRFFTRYYFITGVGAGVVTIVVALFPFAFAATMYDAVVVGASGAVYGLLLAYGLMYPDRPIYLYFLFQIPAKYFVMIVGAVTFISSIGASGGGVAHFAHLGGLLVGYVYLRGRRTLRFNPIAELKYRYIKWKIARMRRRFDVHPGGRDDWDRRIH